MKTKGRYSFQNNDLSLLLKSITYAIGAGPPNDIGGNSGSCPRTFLIEPLTDSYF
jgi:hypothetical protein